MYIQFFEMWYRLVHVHIFFEHNGLFKMTMKEYYCQGRAQPFERCELDWDW